MVQLLKLMPTIELMDMYISDNIEAIFKDVQEKFLKQQQYVRHHDELGQPLNDSVVQSTQTAPKVATARRDRSSSWVWWTVGGVGMAAAVAGGYYLFHDTPAPAKQSFQP